MDDYMDKKTAADLLDNLIGMVEDTQENDYDTALKMGIEALKSNVQPVQNGHWIKDGHHITCDQCGQSMCDKDREGDTIPQNFCPNCGVRMGGEQE